MSYLGYKIITHHDCFLVELPNGARADFTKISSALAFIRAHAGKAQR